MRSASRVFALIAGIIATIIGSLSLVGLILMIVGAGSLGVGGFGVILKPMILCVMFFACGVALLGKKGSDVSKLVVFILMVVILILNQFIWPLSGIFLFTESVLYLISQDLAAAFLLYFNIIMYTILVCTIAAMVLHIIAMAMKQ